MNFFVLFLTLFFAYVVKSSEPEVLTGYLYPTKKQVLRDYLYNDILLPRELINNPIFLKKLHHNNPFLIKRDFVNSGDRIYLEIPFKTKFNKPSIKNKIKRVIAKTTRNNNRIGKLTKGNKENDKLILDFFLTTSFGLFVEKANGIIATSEQNSPITLGTIFENRYNENYSFFGSFYYSKLNTTGVASTDESVHLPPEYGTSSYIIKKNIYINHFVGADYERFSTFNTDERALGVKLSTREHQFLYVTLGISKEFNIFKKKIFIKSSISQSIISQSSRDSLVTSKKFYGNKFLLFTQIGLTKDFSTHFTFKRHVMEGPSQLNISRYGIGITYHLF